MYYVVFLFICVLFGANLVDVDGKTYTETDLFQKYNKKDWDRSDGIQKKKMLDDFVKHVVVEREAEELGFTYRPEVAVKLKDRSNMLLVNAVYEDLVAKPLVDSFCLEESIKNINKEVLVSHILIGHKNAKLREKPNRTKDDAFLIAQQVYKDLKNGFGFKGLADKYSDDPSVVNNHGSLGWLGWGRTVVSFQSTAFSLPVGGFSQPVLTDFGYHVILKEEERGAGFDGLSVEQVEFLALNSCKNAIQPKLRRAAQEFDSLQVEKNNIVFNVDALNILVELFQKEKIKIKALNKYNVDIVSFLNTVSGVGVLCVFDSMSFGCKWFASEFSKIPVSRRPQLDDVSSIKKAFTTVFLQKNAIQLGLKSGVKNGYYYRKNVNDMKGSLLYDTYFKWIVNNAKKPDSTAVQNYYNKNKNTKYKEGEKVVVREIRVLNKDLADSLLLEIKYGADFEIIASNYSKTNPHKGGLIQPFDRGKYNTMGEQAFKLGVGDFSGVIENLDRSFSIIRVDGFLDPVISPLSKVYVRIETLLTREHQEQSKVDAVTSLYEKYKVNVLYDFDGG